MAGFYYSLIGGGNSGLAHASDLLCDQQQPRVDRMDPDASPVMSLALTADKPVRDITEYASKVLRRT